MGNDVIAHLHAATPVDHSWQTVVHDTIYVYSAFRDDRMKKGHIKIIGSSRLVSVSLLAIVRRLCLLMQSYLTGPSL